MRYNLSPIRYAFELVLNLVGHGPRRSCLTPARDPKSRLRFAQYVSRVQPGLDLPPRRNVARLLGQGGALSDGVVRHAPLSSAPAGMRRATFHLVNSGEHGGRGRPVSAGASTALRTLLDALRVR